MSKIFLKLSPGILTAVLLTLAGTLTAAPFDKQISFKQPDGTTIQLHGRGDEFQAVFETLDGYTVVFDQKKKAYAYAKQAGNGELVSTGVLVGRENPSVAKVAKHERMSNEVRKQQFIARWKKWDDQMQVQARWQAQKDAFQQAQYGAGNPSPSYGSSNQIPSSPAGFPTTGLKVGLTLLVDFSDDPATIPQAEIINYCNADNYAGYGNNGSIKKYFYDVSAGLLTYSNVVTVYVRVPQLKTFYNNTTKDAGDQANLLIKDALDTLKALPNYASTILPTFSALTTDGSGEVVACNVFYAGDNGGVWTFGLWPHSWGLYNAGAQDLGNGKKVFRYQITDINNSLSIGTFCHENGHMLLGYPDIYDYDYDSKGGAGEFCLMGYGATDKNPAQISAYLKRVSGWSTTVDVDSTSSLIAVVRANTTTTTNFNYFYRYQKPGVPTEYYIIENRWKAGRDAGLPGSGLAIWHVDELGDHNNQNIVYNNSHLNYELSLIQADNRFDFQNDVNPGDARDLFYPGNPAVGYTNEFSDTTPQRAYWWSGVASGLRVSQISAAAPVMTFQIGYGTVVNTNVITTTIPISAPPPLWGNTLGVMQGSNPNGDWYLFVQDDKRLDIGSISNGWFITLTTGDAVGRAADNQVYLTSASASVPTNSSWLVSLSVTNYGPSDSANVVVTVTLPFNQVSIPPGSDVTIFGNQLTWTVGSLAKDAGASLPLNFTTSSVGTYTAIATVSADNDPNPDDDTASATVLVTAPSEPQLTPSLDTGSGQFRLTVTGDVGQLIIIDASTNMVAWVPILTNVIPFTYTNFNSFTEPVQFYRARTGP